MATKIPPVLLGRVQKLAEMIGTTVKVEKLTMKDLVLRIEMDAGSVVRRFETKFPGRVPFEKNGNEYYGEFPAPGVGLVKIKIMNTGGDRSLMHFDRG